MYISDFTSIDLFRKLTELKTSPVHNFFRNLFLEFLLLRFFIFLRYLTNKFILFLKLFFLFCIKWEWLKHIIRLKKLEFDRICVNLIPMIIVSHIFYLFFILLTGYKPFFLLHFFFLFFKVCLLNYVPFIFNIVFLLLFWFCFLYIRLIVLPFNLFANILELVVNFLLVNEDIVIFTMKQLSIWKILFLLLKILRNIFFIFLFMDLLLWIGLLLLFLRFLLFA